MISSSYGRSGRLHGKTVFLSASIPSKERRADFQRVPEAAINIEAAVIALARAVFLQSGSLVFGAHPSISPLMARLVREYAKPQPAEPRGGSAENENAGNPSVIIYQSEVFRPHLEEAVRELQRNPYVTVRWTKAAAGETFRPGSPAMVQTPESLVLMRRQMIEESAPLAMVAIGGMEGVLKEAELFARYSDGRRRLFALGSTGGAAQLLAEGSFALRGAPIEVPDKESAALIKKFWAENEQRLAQRRAEGFEELYMPYDQIAGNIVQSLLSAEV